MDLFRDDFFSTFSCCNHFLAQMQAGRYVHLVNVSIVFVQMDTSAAVQCRVKSQIHIVGLSVPH